MKSYDEIVEEIYNMNDEEIVNIWNEYCDYANDEDDKIYPMEDFEEVAEPPSKCWDEFWEMFDDLKDFDRNAAWFYKDDRWDCWTSLDNPWDRVDEDAMAKVIADGSFEPSWDFEEEEDDD